MASDEHQAQQIITEREFLGHTDGRETIRVSPAMTPRQVLSGRRANLQATLERILG